MSTDFADIKNLSVEIGQSTYVELISVKSRQEIAIRSATPNVEAALNSLAFGRKLDYVAPVREQTFVSTARTETTSSQKYSLKSAKASDHRSERISSEFRSLMNNPTPYDIPICSTGPVTCDAPATPCPIDFGVCLDDTGSMRDVIALIRASVDTIADYFQIISGGNYRMGLITFKDCPTTPRVRFPTTGTCGNIAEFKAALSTVTAFGGEGAPEAGDVALRECVDGTAFGPWRDDPDVIKVILYITDNAAAGCNDIYEPADSQSLRDIATAAASCDIKIMTAATPARHSSVVPDLTAVANITGGIFVHTTSTGVGLAELLYSYIFSLCGASTPTPECLGGTDVIINGKFDINVAGWEQFGASHPSGPALSWNASKMAMELYLGTARQTVTGLIPGDLVTLFFDYSGGPSSGILTYGFVSGTSTTVAVPAGAGWTRLSLNMTIPESGIVTVSFTSTARIFIDNVKLCVVPVTDCGPGTRNLALNPNFANGVQFWTDDSDEQLSPLNDTRWWDSGNDALIISLTGASEVRQTINDLTVGRSMTFGFTLLAHEPETIDDIELVYGILDGSGNLIAEASIKNADIESFPHFITQQFIATSSIKIFFRTGSISGVARIRDVLVCDLTGVCQPGYERVSFTDFQTNRNGWIGGTFTSGILQLNEGNQLSQTFPGLEQGSILQISFGLLDSGGVVVEMSSGSAVDQFTTDDAPGIYSFSTTVQETGLVHITIRPQGATVRLDNILICKSAPPACDGSISAISAHIRWNGTPRRPMNIFNMFARITLRDPVDPLLKTVSNLIPINDGHLGVESPLSCGTGSTCDFWKQQGNGGFPENPVTKTNLSPSSIKTINAGSFNSVASRVNWLWAIPANPNGAVQDALVVTFNPASVGKVVESVELLYLANQVVPSTIASAEVCSGPFICSPDPADEFEIVLKYRNSRGFSREFSATVPRNNLYPQQENFLIGNPWDTITSLGNGLKGSSARWESAIFYLDTTAGTGLDQCTVPLNLVTSGSGDLNFGKFGISGSGSFYDPCDAEVIVEEITRGVRNNEVQSITLPSPAGGTWDLTVIIKGVLETATIPWNATADVLQIRIGRLTNVGHGNVSVAGSGTIDDPYHVEFIGELAGMNLPLMIADGSGLTGTSPGAVETIQDATKNERQTISVAAGTLDDLIVEFNGATSIPIIYNWSLDQKQSAIEGISTVGAGNVAVSGRTTDRENPYVGDLFLDFIGTFAGDNVPEAVVEPTPNYSITTNWNGGAGVNEKQRIRILASSGTFTIKIYNPEDPANLDYFITAPIPYNATADQLKEAIIESGYVTDEIIVEKSPENPSQPSLHEWLIEFAGAETATPFEQMEIDVSGLRGGDITVNNVSEGGSINEKQRITIKNANGGFFRLHVNINDVSEQSQRIVWDTTAQGLQQVLEFHSEIQVGDVAVVQNGNGPDPDVVARFTVTFKRFGDVPLMIPEFGRTLLCNPILLSPVPPPPYNYPLPQECDLEDLSCQSGPLLSRPCPGDEPLPDELCCDEFSIRSSANVSIGFTIQRDLFDPNKKTTPYNGTPRRMTVKDIAKIKGHNVANFTPYLRNFQTGRLVETTYSKELETGLSVILIEKSFDTVNGRARIQSHLASHREILPTRMVWPTEIIPASN